MTTPAGPPTQLRRALAALAVVSAVLHLLMLGHGPLWLGLIMAALAVACFPCVGHLWRGPSLRTWISLGAMNAGMLLIHLWILSAGTTTPAAGPEPAAHHHHGAPGLHLDHSLLLWAATLAAVVEVCGAAWAYSEVLSGKAITERKRIGRLTSAVGPWGASPSNCSESPGRSR